MNQPETIEDILKLHMFEPKKDSDPDGLTTDQALAAIEGRR